ncbi:MAG: hypothetical protein EPO40_03115 [Myxococcaceae bacterium]|nr:MAG: hypothetical protein EPO40_03115 [Myxococcaceae bacterium]
MLTYPGPTQFPGPTLYPLGSLMAIVTPQNPGLQGITPQSNSASAGGDTVPPGTRVRVVNGGGASITCTVVTPGTVRGLAVADQPIEIPAGTTKTFDVPGDLYGDPANGGMVSLQWSATTSVTFFVEGPVLS